MGILKRSLLIAVAAAAATSPSQALETDPFFAWGRDLDDSAPVLNAKMNLEIDAVLARIGNSGRAEELSCDDVVDRLLRDLRRFLFHTPELWLINSPLVSRVPATPEEEKQYRRRYTLHRTHVLDPATWMPPSPTIEVDGIRIGTDKVAHFLSQGGYYRGYYLDARREGQSPQEATDRALRRGLWVERTVLGGTSSGVLSLADLEANEQGMRWLVGLCHGDDPGLALEDGAWVRTRPFDIRDHVTPAWDEAWNPNVYGPRRWAKVRPVLEGYCDRLDSDGVRERRDRYARRAVDSRTRRLVEEAVRNGRIPDPATFGIEAVCGGRREDPPATPAVTPRSPNRGAGDGAGSASRARIR